ncbi:MAG: hypothetical protein ACYSTZ_01865 [Planctomycetota bacterium]
MPLKGEESICQIIETRSLAVEAKKQSKAAKNEQSSADMYENSYRCVQCNLFLKVDYDV